LLRTRAFIIFSAGGLWAAGKPPGEQPHEGIFYKFKKRKGSSKHEKKNFERYLGFGILRGGFRSCASGRHGNPDNRDFDRCDI
ncbi:MAG: hypothetical protein FWH48_09605, partial [Oscillospiraceae bacterium]|nr:hypothetical protein [Oscillospiraceae bacterium]